MESNAVEFHEFCQSKLWDLNATWYSAYPEFTPCFQNTVLVWVPCGLIWLFLILEVVSFVKSQRRDIPWSILNITKIILVLFLLAVTIYNLANDFKRKVYLDDEFLSHIVKGLTYIILLSLVLLGRKYGTQSSVVQFLFWLILTINQLAIVLSRLNNLHTKPMKFFPSAVELPLIFFMMILCCISDKRPIYLLQKDLEQNQSPEEESSFLSKLTSFWMFDIIWRGNQKDLTMEDIYNLSSVNRSKPSYTVLKNILMNIRLNENDKKAKNNRNKKTNSSKPKYPNIALALFKAFGTSFLVKSIFCLITETLYMVNPFLIVLIMKFVSSDEPLWKGFFYAILLQVIELLQLIGFEYQQRTSLQVSLRVQSALRSLLFEKILMLSNNERNNLALGVILNSMSVNIDGFQKFFSRLNFFWTFLVQIIIITFYLWKIVGLSTLAVLLTIFVLVLLTVHSIYIYKVYQGPFLACMDKRAKMMNEIFNGIRVLKLYAWEKPFQSIIEEMRNKEYFLLRKLLLLYSYVVWQKLLNPQMITLIAFGVYSFSSKENVLTPTIVIIGLRLFSILSTTMVFLSEGFNCVADATISLRRIEKILDAEELEEYVDKTGNLKEYAINISGGTFSWERNGTLILKNINLRVKKNELVIVFGKIASGKSSLLSAILGNMENMNGSVSVQGEIAYVPQQAWIQNSSLRNNIIFNKPFDVAKYETVVDACALNTDIDLLPAFDNTEVGEKGINLSGGQKQRVSLARAIYMDHDIYLLDDPLGAVDSHTGKHIFEKVIGPTGLLKNKTRILITHNTEYLQYADASYFLVDGEIFNGNSVPCNFLEPSISNEIRIFQLDKFKNNMNRTGKDYFQNSNTNVEENIPLWKRKKQEERKKEISSNIIVSENSTSQSSWSVLRTYLQNLGSWSCFGLFIGFSVSQFLSFYSQFWLFSWSQDNLIINKDNATSVDSKARRFGIYTTLGISQLIISLATLIAFMMLNFKVSMKMFSGMLNTVLRCSMSFFESTPIGRIANRFAKDVWQTDFYFPVYCGYFLTRFFVSVGSIIAISIKIPIILVAAVLIIPIMLFIQRSTSKTNQQLKRLAATQMSPLFSQFSDSFSGASVINAYGVGNYYKNITHTLNDKYQAVNYMSETSIRAINFQGNILAMLLSTVVTFYCVLERKSFTPAECGFVLFVTYNMINSVLLVSMVLTNVEAVFVSLERIVEYQSLPSEAEWEKPDQNLSALWPEKGKIEFRNYSTSYRKELELVLKDITFVIQPIEKVGVVGRTGAGKSSLTLALFRIIEASSGKIFIDDIDIGELGLYDLRSRISIIPQDPVLFSTTLRINLDPFDQYSEEDIWSALEQSHLKEFVKEFKNGLDHKIDEGGQNLSVGQRQLVCLARALLRKSKVLVLDEATASVDSSTDNLIQETINQEFKSCTIITIAHRLHTIMDYDRVLVLDHGTIVEFDKPQNLIEDHSSKFFSLARDAGIV